MNLLVIVCLLWTGAFGLPRALPDAVAEPAAAPDPVPSPVAAAAPNPNSLSNLAPNPGLFRHGIYTEAYIHRDPSKTTTSQIFHYNQYSPLYPYGIASPRSFHYYRTTQLHKPSVIYYQDIIGPPQMEVPSSHYKMVHPVLDKKRHREELGMSRLTTNKIDYGHRRTAPLHQRRQNSLLDKPQRRHKFPPLYYGDLKKMARKSRSEKYGSRNL